MGECVDEMKRKISTWLQYTINETGQIEIIAVLTVMWSVQFLNNEIRTLMCVGCYYYYSLFFLMISFKCSDAQSFFCVFCQQNNRNEFHWNVSFVNIFSFSSSNELRICIIRARLIVGNVVLQIRTSNLFRFI